MINGGVSSHRGLIMDYKLQLNIPKYNKTVFIVFLLITLNKFSIDLGFSLKPYMMFLFLFIMIHLSSFYFQKLQLFEVAMLLFYLAYSYTGAFSLYPASSIRIILGIALYLSCYFIMKCILGYTADSIIEKSISYVGIIFNLASLILYIVGLQRLNFVFKDEWVVEYGVMVDRSYPRLIGLLQDPNFYVFYNTLFFSYYLCNGKLLKNRLGLILCIITNVLTFSRGGLIALMVIFFLYILMNKPLKQLKLLLGLIVSLSAVIYIAVVQFKFNVYGILESRMQDFSSDGGSGRFKLWERSWDYFSSHILVGIGAFNFSEYNLFQYQDSLTAHNTFLDILSESGILGFFFYVSFVLLVIFQLIESRIYKQKPYLFLTFIGFVFQMSFLSIIINDILFMYLAILSVYLQKCRDDTYKLDQSNVKDVFP